MITLTLIITIALCPLPPLWTTHPDYCLNTCPDHRSDTALTSLSLNPSPHRNPDGPESNTDPYHYTPLSNPSVTSSNNAPLQQRTFPKYTTPPSNHPSCPLFFPCPRRCPYRPCCSSNPASPPLSNHPPCSYPPCPRPIPFHYVQPLPHIHTLPSYSNCPRCLHYAHCPYGPDSHSPYPASSIIFLDTCPAL